MIEERVGRTLVSLPLHDQVTRRERNTNRGFHKSTGFQNPKPAPGFSLPQIISNSRILQGGGGFRPLEIKSTGCVHFKLRTVFSVDKTTKKKGPIKHNRALVPPHMSLWEVWNSLKLFFIRPVPQFHHCKLTLKLHKWTFTSPQNLYYARQFHIRTFQLASRYSEYSF
jgi:hypothetical protein